MKNLKLYITIFLLILALFLISEKNTNNRAANVVRFASWGSQSETAVLKEIIRDYEKEKEIKIDFIHIPQNYFQKIQLLFASGLEPDVVFFNNQNIQMYIKNNLLEDLSQYIDTELFYPEALNCFKYNDGIYAMPRDISTLVLYYNKDIIKKSNEALSNEIKDIYSLVQILNKINSQKCFGINFEEDPLFWSYYLASNGGGIVSDDKTKLIINESQSIAALQLYTDMINKYHIMPSKSQIGSKTTAQMFINGETAMYLGGRWMTPKFRETITFDWDVIMFPAPYPNKLYADASGWALTTKSKNKDAAIDFIKYLSSEKSLEKLAQTGLIIPANIKAAEWTIEQDKNKKPCHSKVFIDMLNKTKPTPVNENYSVINDIIKEKSALIFSGKEKAENAFDIKTVKKIESFIK